MDAVLKLELMFVDWVNKDLRQRTLHRAALAAHCRLAHLHPDWNAALFDKHFIVTWVAPLLIQAAADNTGVSEHAIATAWAHQLSGTPNIYRRRHHAVLPIAACYLQLVAEALEIEYDGAARRGQPDICPAAN